MQAVAAWTRMPTAESLTDQHLGAQPTQVTEVHALQPNFPFPIPGPAGVPSIYLSELGPPHLCIVFVTQD